MTGFIVKHGRKFSIAVFGLSIASVLAAFGLLMLKWAPAAGGPGSISAIVGSVTLLVGGIVGAFMAGNSYVEGKHATTPTRSSTVSTTTTVSGAPVATPASPIPVTVIPAADPLPVAVQTQEQPVPRSPE